MRRRMPSWVPSVALVPAAFALVFFVTHFDDPDASDPGAAAAITTDVDSSTTSQGWSHGYDGATRNAQEHWAKHRGDFPEDRSAADYESEAQRFIAHPPPGALIKHRANGDTLLYDPDTNTFAVEDRAGEPRTMFRPNSGRAYWERQH